MASRRAEATLNGPTNTADLLVTGSVVCVHYFIYDKAEKSLTFRLNLFEFGRLGGLSDGKFLARPVILHRPIGG